MHREEFDHLPPDAFELPTMSEETTARLLDVTTRRIGFSGRRARLTTVCVFAAGLILGFYVGRQDATPPDALPEGGEETREQPGVPDSPLWIDEEDEVGTLVQLADRLLEREGDVRSAIDLYGDHLALARTSGSAREDGSWLLSALEVAREFEEESR